MSNSKGRKATERRLGQLLGDNGAPQAVKKDWGEGTSVTATIPKPDQKADKKPTLRERKRKKTEDWWLGKGPIPPDILAKREEEARKREGTNDRNRPEGE